MKAFLAFFKQKFELYGPNINVNFTKGYYFICMLNFEYPDQKIVGNFFQPIGFILTQNPIH